MAKLNQRIAILGSRGIGLPIAEGITNSEITENKVIITRKNSSFSEKEKEQFVCYYDNNLAVKESDIIVIAVQPKQFNSLIEEIRNELTDKHILISIVSGVSISDIESLVRKNIAVIRAMPNTAIKVGQSMTCLVFNKLGENFKSLVQIIFNSVGQTLLIEEAQFPEATVLCGSGPAFIFEFMNGYILACIQHGFNKEQAMQIASQVTKGAAEIIQKTKNDPALEIKDVTTPGGCTIYALVEMQHAGLNSALLKGIEIGIGKAKKLYSKT